MNLLSQSAFLRGLGWSLMDSVWQLGFLWLMFHLLTSGGKKFSAASRYNLALLSLLGGVSLFLGGIIYRVSSNDFSSPLLSRVFQVDYDLSFSTLQQVLSYISGLYIIIAMVLVSRFFFQYRYTRQLRTLGLKKASPELRVFVQERSGQMGIKRKVEIWFSSLVDAPLTIGFFKPVILLPVAVMNQLNLKQAEAILLHELEHIRRNDYLVNLVIAFSSTLLFFNPFARNLVAILKKERENSCDDRVIYFDYSVSEYASALLVLEKQRNNVHATALQAIGNNKNLLLNRVKRIVTGEKTRTPIDLGLVTLFGLFMTIALVGWYKEELAIKGPDTFLPAVYAAIDQEQDELDPSTLTKNTSDRLMGPISERNNQVIVLQHPQDLQEHPAGDIIVIHADDQEFPAEGQDYQVEFVDNKINRDYSINEPGEVPAPPPPPVGPAGPYIPSTSLAFQLMEDTSINRYKIATVHEQMAKEALQKALIELEKLCSENEGLDKLAEIDLKKLKQELKKSTEVAANWQQIEAEIRNANAQMQNNVRIQQELEKFHKNRVLHQEKVNKIKEQILLERLGSSGKKTVVL